MYAVKLDHPFPESWKCLTDGRPSVFRAAALLPQWRSPLCRWCCPPPRSRFCSGTRIGQICAPTWASLLTEDKHKRTETTHEGLHQHGSNLVAFSVWSILGDPGADHGANGKLGRAQNDGGGGGEGRGGEEKKRWSKAANDPRRYVCMRAKQAPLSVEHL